MIGQKLINILQSLDAEEFKRLKRALSSPYFATNFRLIDLYDYLRKYYPSFGEDKLHKDKLFKKLYPGKPFNDGVLRVLVREFSNVVEDFIILERLRADKLQRKKMLVKEYGNRNLYVYFKKGTEEIFSEIDGDFVKDMEYFSAKIELYQDYCFHPLTNTYDSKDNSLEHLMDSLDAYFVLAKYRFAQIVKNRDTILQKESEIKFLDVLIEDKYDLSSTYILTGIYNLLNKLHDTGEEGFFFKYKQLFFKNIDKIKRFDCRIIYFIGLNYCSRKISAGLIAFSNEALIWYKLGLEKKLLIDNGKMSDITFTNICATACREGEINWAIEFVENNRVYLDEKIEADAINYSNILLYFYQEKYEKALQIINSYYFSRRYQLSARSFTALAMFEQAIKDHSYFSILFSQIEADRKYLLRDTTYTDTKKNPHRNLLKLVDKLAKKLYEGNDKKQIKKWLGEYIKNEKILASRSWFVEKYENF